MVKEKGCWVGVSTAEFMIGVEELFFGLRTLGIHAGQRVAILSENRIEWAMADFATAALGAVTAPIYPTLPAAQIACIIRDCGASLAFVSSLAQLDKIEAIRKSLPTLKFVVVFDSTVYRAGAVHLQTVLRAGREASFADPQGFWRAAVAVQPEDLATIIYTSGTTGAAKGVMLTHRNLILNVLATSELLPLGSSDLELSFLPLSHIFQRHVDYAALYAGSMVAYAQDVTNVVDDMAQLRPTFGAAVPRFFEKVRALIASEVSRRSAVEKRVFERALGARPSSPLWRAADRAVFRKIRRRFGGRIRWFISGGAPLNPSIAEFFHIIGMPIIEGYGMTEASPVITFSAPGCQRIGRVGRPVSGVEVRFAVDGEVLVRGPNVMRGYYNSVAETEQALANGWLHTGDIGRLDADGYLEITGRKKDLIVTSTGKKIAPQLLEARLQLIPYFEHTVVIGDRRSFITALVAPNYQALAEYARVHDIPYVHAVDLIRRPEIYDLAMREISAQSQDLAEYERIKRIAFIEAPLSIASGDLTPTLKVRRDEIVKKYRTEIDLLYAA